MLNVFFYLLQTRARYELEVSIILESENVNILFLKKLGAKALAISVTWPS